MKPILLVILALVGLNFALQSFDWLSFSNSTCGFYRFNPDCVSLYSFLANKLVRLALHFLILFLIQKTFFQDVGIKFNLLYGALFILALLDITLLQGDDFLSGRLHGLLNPVVFSPLISLVLLVLGVKGVFPPGPPSRGELL
jgi:hypothetical protein